MVEMRPAMLVKLRVMFDEALHGVVTAEAASRDVYPRPTCSADPARVTAAALFHEKKRIEDAHSAPRAHT